MQKRTTFAHNYYTYFSMYSTSCLYIQIFTYLLSTHIICIFLCIVCMRTVTYTYFQVIEFRPFRQFYARSTCSFVLGNLWAFVVCMRAPWGLCTHKRFVWKYTKGAQQRSLRQIRRSAPNRVQLGLVPELFGPLNIATGCCKYTSYCTCILELICHETSILGCFDLETMQRLIMQCCCSHCI